MGTDIHLQAERWTGDKWERIPHPPTPCWSCADYDREAGEYGEPRGWFHPWVDPGKEEGYDVLDVSNGRHRIAKREQCWHCKGTKIVHEQWWHDRNYDVFAILADVRNGSGFAGIRTSAGFNVIAERRGLPDDLSAEVSERIARLGWVRGADGDLEYRRDADEGDDLYDLFDAEQDGYWDLGEHSLSWLTLAEIMDFDWSQQTMLEGWVDPGNFEAWRTDGEPRSWSGAVSGANVEHVSNRAMAELIDSGNIQFEDGPDDLFSGRPYTTDLQRAMREMGSFPKGSHGATMQDRPTSYYTLVEWPRVYRTSARKFLEAMGRLAAHAPDGDPSRIRIVFGFDS